MCDIRPGCETLPLVDEKDEDEAAALVRLGQNADSELDAALKAGTRAAARELVAKLPLARSYFAILDYASRRAQEREAATFFELVAKHSRAGNTGDLLVDLVEGLDKQHVYEAVTLGYQAMRSCADEALKPCLAVLVSQQIYEPNLPTAYYRAASGLHVELDAGAASGLSVRVEQVALLVTGWSDECSTPCILRCTETDDAFEAPSFWVACRTGTDGPPEYWNLERLLLPPHAHRAVQVLERHGWSASMTGWGYGGDREGVSGTIWQQLPTDRLSWFTSLHDCLRVLEVN